MKSCFTVCMYLCTYVCICVPLFPRMKKSPKSYPNSGLNSYYFSSIFNFFSLMTFSRQKFLHMYLLCRHFGTIFGHCWVLFGAESSGHTASRCILSARLFAAVARVTRLGEFSPIGRLFMYFR
jgi:hypothetical protein